MPPTSSCEETLCPRPRRVHAVGPRLLVMASRRFRSRLFKSVVLSYSGQLRCATRPPHEQLRVAVEAQRYRP